MPCPFCADLENIVHADDRVVAVRDRYPVSPGHTLIVPLRHIETWFDATPEGQRAILDVVDIVKRKLDAGDPRPDGFNVGFNAGAAAGQTVMHLHVHIIPRYRGDMDDPRGGVRHVIPGKGKSPDGKWIATTGDDKTVRVWNASTGTELFQVPIKDNGTTLGFSKDGKYLIAGDQSGFINIWDIADMPAPANYLQFNGVTTDTLYSPTGGLIAASDDKRIWLLNPSTLSKLTTRPSVNPFGELRSNINKLVFSPKEKWVGAITTRNDVVIYNTQNRSGKTLRPKNLVQAIVFSPDEKQLFIGDGAGNLQVWDTSTGTFQDTPLALSSPIAAMTSSADLHAIGTDNTIIIFDINTLTEDAPQPPRRRRARQPRRVHVVPPRGHLPALSLGRAGRGRGSRRTAPAGAAAPAVARWPPATGGCACAATSRSRRSAATASGTSLRRRAQAGYTSGVAADPADAFDYDT